MRIPSRLMPKTTPQKLRLSSWLFLGVIVALLLYLFLLNPLVIGTLFGGLTAMSIAMSKIRNQRLRQLAATRSRKGICEFARAFNTRETDTWIIRAVYEEVQGCLGTGFPLRAADRFQQDLHLDPDDLDMVIALRVAERSGRSLEETKRNPYYERVVTAGDLVKFFNSQPRTRHMTTAAR